MGSPARFAPDRILECPGPCNPKNKVCRRTCVQNMITILEDLPPCIRSRLRQEDLMSMFAKDQDFDQSCAGNPSNPSSQTMAACEGRPCVVSERSSASTDVDERSAEMMASGVEEEGTQTIEEKRVQTEQTIRQITSQFGAIASETKTFAQQTKDGHTWLPSFPNGDRDDGRHRAGDKRWAVGGNNGRGRRRRDNGRNNRKRRSVDGRKRSSDNGRSGGGDDGGGTSSSGKNLVLVFFREGYHLFRCARYARDLCQAETDVRDHSLHANLRTYRYFELEIIRHRAAVSSEK